ncbi:MAG: hypothetical protein ILP14_06890 [Oscillospiraceae bacterium]|nr:hypothetical protein [Oscillospiraceae bacterium]
MKDLIERQAVLDILAQYEDSEDLAGVLIRIIKELPSVNTEKTGHWILLDECSNSGYYCSECHKKVVKEGWSETVKKIKFCLNCGAKMVEPQESEDKE